MIFQSLRNLYPRCGTKSLEISQILTLVIILVAVGVEILVLRDGRQTAAPSSALRVAVLDEARGGLPAARVVVPVRRGGSGRGGRRGCHVRRRRRGRGSVVPLYVVLENVVGALICKGGGDR